MPDIDIATKGVVTDALNSDHVYVGISGVGLRKMTLASLAAKLAISTGTTYFMPTASLTVNGNDANATTNTTNINNALAAYDHVILPKSGNVTDGFEINGPILLTAGKTLSGQGPVATQLRQRAGANLECMVASTNWYNSTGAPSLEGRGISITDIGFDGQYLNRTTGAVLQTAGAGHGFAGCTYGALFFNVSVAQTRGHGIFLDTTGRDGITSLGEGIENAIINCTTTRTGLSGIYCEDTAGIDGGVTDGQLLYTEVTHPNIRNVVTGEDGHGVFVRSAGGWFMAGNHIYGASTFTGNYAGYAAGSKLRDGIKCMSASGLRMVGNQVADFGYVGTVGTYYGVNVQGQDDRGFLIDTTTIWTDQDNPSNTLWAIRITTPSDKACQANITGNVMSSRAAVPTMNGILINAATGGSWSNGVIANNSMLVPTATKYSAVASDFNFVVANNTWQKGSGGQLIVPMYTNANANLTLTAQTQVEQFLANSTRSITQVNLSEYREVRIVTRVLTASTSINGPKVTAKYSTTFQTGLGSISDIGTTPVESSLAATGMATSAWIPLVAAAKADVFVTITQTGGDGAQAPAIGHLVLEFR